MDRGDYRGFNKLKEVGEVVEVEIYGEKYWMDVVIGVKQMVKYIQENNIYVG